MIHDPEAVLLALHRLPVLAPDARRAALVRERCRTRLGRRASATKRTLGLAVFGSLCVLYLAALAIDILRLGAGV